MRITFTTWEIDEWLEALKRCFCTAAEEDIRQYEMIIKKLKNAEIRSNASKEKYRHLRQYQWEKEKEIRADTREGMREARKRLKLEGLE